MGLTSATEVGQTANKSCSPGGDCLTSKAVMLASVAILAAISLSLLLPKAMLLSYMQGRRLAFFGPTEVLTIFVQDLSLACIVLGLLASLLRRVTVIRLVLCSATTTAILSLLFIDGRVRELWLRPLNWDMVTLYYHFSSELSSGNAIFFCHGAGLGMTFRRVLVCSIGCHAGLWLLFGLHYLRARRTEASAGERPSARWWKLPGAALGIAVGLFIAACLAAPMTYQAQKNILISWLVDPLTRTQENTEELRRLAGDCDEPLRPFRDVSSKLPRRVHISVTMQNVIIVMLESVRWKGLALTEGGHTPMPALRRLARDGLLVKCYVSMPESTKALYTVMTGRYPYPGSELREGMHDRVPSLLRSLRKTHEYMTFCFSSQYLGFRNMFGVLRACGVDCIMGPGELVPRATKTGRTGSSFGLTDELLLDDPLDRLAQHDVPFGAVMIPLAAHYPYDYPGKTRADDVTWRSYLKSLAYTDDWIGRLMKACERLKLTDRTLFVFIGDHGEMFGEHGVYTHGSSIYEEEICVPAVFWAANRSLHHGQVLVGRQVDVAPTIGDILGLEDKAWDVQGRSLLRSFADPPPVYVSTFFDNIAEGLVLGNRKFRYLPGTGELALFDLRSDPNENAPLVVSGCSRGRILHRMGAFRAYQKVMAGH